MIARSILLALFLLLIPAAAAPAAAAELSSGDAIAQLNEARDLIDASAAAYEAGRPDESLNAAQQAYLDHFELVELSLRVRDEHLTLGLEEAFATLRSRIREHAPVPIVLGAARQVRAGLDDAERALSTPGLAAPVLAFGYSFTILFREGIEAVLVVALVLSSLAATRNLRYRRPVLAGVAAAVAATIATFLVLTLVLTLAPVQRELLEAVMTVLAVVLLFYVSFWLIARLDQRRWMEFMRSRITVAAAGGSTMALFGLGFTSIYREGVETVLFYQALLAFGRGLEVWIAAGALASVAVLAVVAWIVFRSGRRIPVKKMLGTAVIMLMVLSVAFAGNGIRAFQAVGALPLTVLHGVPSLPFFLSELTGWHPTVETIVGQAILAVIYIAGGIWTFGIAKGRLARPRSGPAGAGA